jgi:hypothetical protein
MRGSACVTRSLFQETAAAVPWGEMTSRNRDDGYAITGSE